MDRAEFALETAAADWFRSPLTRRLGWLSPLESFPDTLRQETGRIE